MVVTRRGTSLEPQVATEKRGEQNSLNAASPNRTQRTAQNEYEAARSGGNIQDQSESEASATRTDALQTPAKATTRSRQSSSANVSDTKSTVSSSSARVTQSRLSLSGSTATARRLRSCKSVVTELILESKEDEVSEAESNCSSVSTRARRTRARVSCPVRSRIQESALVSELDSDHSEAGSHCSSVSTRARRTRARVSRPVRSRIQESALVSELDSDHSEAGPYCSSVLGLQNAATKSTETSEATCLPSPESQSQREEISEAESLSSGFSSQPLIKRSSRRIQYNVQIEQAKGASKAVSEDRRSPMRQKSYLHGLQVTEPCSSGIQQTFLSTPRRSMRSQTASFRSEIISNADSPYKELSNEDRHVEDKETVAVEDNAKVVPEMPEASQSITPDTPDQISNLTEEIGDEQDQCKAIEEDVNVICEKAGDLESQTSVPESEQSSVFNEAKSTGFCLMLASDSSEAEADREKEEKKHEELDNSEDESDVEMEESHLAFSRKPKKVAANQLKDMAVDGLFVIDTAPGVDSTKKYYVDHEEQNKEPVAEQSEVEELSEPEDNEEDEDFIDEDEEDELLNRPKRGFVLSTSIDTGLSVKEMGGLYISFDAEKPNPGPSLLNKIKRDHKKDELLKKSIITPDFEKKDAVPPYRESLCKLKKMRKEEREKTTGHGWFDMKAPELTQELKNDLKALKMRSAMNPKHFYKKNDREGFPKYFQVGTVVDNPADFYHSRIPKKQRKRTIVEELLADSEFRRYNKKKYQEIIAEKTARAEGKKNRKKKKFRS